MLTAAPSVTQHWRYSHKKYVRLIMGHPEQSTLQMALQLTIQVALKAPGEEPYLPFYSALHLSARSTTSSLRTSLCRSKTATVRESKGNGLPSYQGRSKVRVFSIFSVILMTTSVVLLFSNLNKTAWLKGTAGAAPRLFASGGKTR